MRIAYASTMLMLIASLTTPAFAQNQGDTYFLKIDGIAGTSDVPGRSSWLEIESFSLNIEYASRRGATAGPLTCVRVADAVSPELTYLMVRGRKLSPGDDRPIILEIVRPNDEGLAVTATRYEFSDALLVRQDQGGRDGNHTLEELTIVYTQLRYTTFDDGSPLYQTEWDFQAGVASQTTDADDRSGAVNQGDDATPTTEQ